MCGVDKGWAQSGSRTLKMGICGILFLVFRSATAIDGTALELVLREE